MLSIEKINSLTKGIKRGSEKDLKEFYKHTRYFLIDVCKRMGVSEEDAEEILQDTYYTLWKQRSQIDEKYNVLGLLKTIAKRKVIKKLSKNFPEELYENLPEPKEESLTLNEINENNKDKLLDLINVLPQRQKEVIDYYYFKQYTKKQVSEVMGISSHTVDNHLHCAKSNLKRICKQKKIDLTFFYDV